MKQTTKTYLTIAVAFIAVACVISVSLPHEKAVNFSFEVGKPWRYEQLTSTFSFAVYKSESALQQEREKVKANQRPYYILDDAVGSM